MNHGAFPKPCMNRIGVRDLFLTSLNCCLQQALQSKFCASQAIAKVIAFHLFQINPHLTLNIWIFLNIFLKKGLVFCCVNFSSLKKGITPEFDVFITNTSKADQFLSPDKTNTMLSYIFFLTLLVELFVQQY